MKAMKTRVILSTAAAVLLLLSALPGGGQGAKVEVGKTAPDFKLIGIDGQPAQVSWYMNKRPVVIEFFAVDCIWCPKAAPGTRELAQSHPNTRLQLLTVAADGSSKAEVAEYAKAVGYEGFPVLVDTAGKAKSLYGITRVPTTVLIGKSGKVLRIYKGWTTELEEAIAEDVNAAVKGRPLPTHDIPLLGHT